MKAPSLHLLKLYIIPGSRLAAAGGWTGIGGGAAGLLLLLHLLLHPGMHFTELFLETAAGDINRDDQFKDQLVGQVDEYGVENIFHGTKISRAPRRLPGLTITLPIRTATDRGLLSVLFGWNSPFSLLLHWK